MAGWILMGCYELSWRLGSGSLAAASVPLATSEGALESGGIGSMNIGGCMQVPFVLEGPQVGGG